MSGYKGKNFDPNFAKKKFGGGGGFQKPQNGFQQQGGFQQQQGGFQQGGGRGGGFQKPHGGFNKPQLNKQGYTIKITGYPQNLDWKTLLGFLNSNAKFRFVSVRRRKN